MEGRQKTWAEDLEAVDEGRRAFIEGLRWLESGELKKARQVFRRGARRLQAPYDTMARLAQARLEVEAGRQGMALRILRDVAHTCEEASLRQWAWMEIADLARQRGQQPLAQEADDAMDAIGIRPGSARQ